MQPTPTTQPARLEDSMPHFTTSERAKFQIHHHVMFDNVPAAVAVLRTFGLSCRRGDYDGELARYIGTSVHRNQVLHDGDTLAVLRTN
jgi:hypothetical protein